MYFEKLFKSKLVSSYKQLNLFQIGEEDLTNFSDFVFKMYSYHYYKKYSWIPMDNEQNDMRNQDIKQFENSIYFGFKNLENILIGTIKATLKTGRTLFAVEYEFNINVFEVIKEKQLEVNQIWHLGRLAINSKKLKEHDSSLTSKRLIHNLLVQIFGVINKQPNSLIIAESDVLIYHIFRDLGVNMQIIGECQECLGSPTYPVIITDVENWLTRNKIEELELVS